MARSAVEVALLCEEGLAFLPTSLLLLVLVGDVLMLVMTLGVPVVLGLMLAVPSFVPGVVTLVLVLTSLLWAVCHELVLVTAVVADQPSFFVTPPAVGVELLELGDHERKGVVIQGLHLLLCS